MEIRNVLERLKLLTNDDREDLLLMLSGAGGVSVLAFGGSSIAEKPDGGRGARGI